MTNDIPKLSGCCNASVDILASLPLCVRCNGELLPETYEPFPERHIAGHNERCGLGRNKDEK